MKLELKSWKAEDARKLAEVFNGSDRRFTSNRRPTPYPVEAAREWLESVQEREGKDGLFYAVLADGAYVGFITVEQAGDVHCRDSEIGYLIKKEYEGRGITSWAVAEISRMAFEQLPVTRLTGYCFSANAASCRVLEKNGYVLEGVMKQALYKNGVVDDECIYAKYRS